MKEKNPNIQEITELVKDKEYGLPMQDKMTIETYDEKKERFSKTEDFLAKLISETNDNKLMHTFLRWQNLRNQLNQMYVSELEKTLNKSK